MPQAEVCVFCRKHRVDPAWRPFCSERCQLLDLAKWADGGYGIPADAVPTDDDDDDQES